MRPEILQSGLMWLFLMAAAALASANKSETSDQIWANVVLSHPRSERTYLEYDIESARQVSGGEPWRYLFGTGLIEYYPSPFIDLTGEISTGFTKQDRAEDSFEATFRGGVRLHLIRQIFNSSFARAHRPERMSGKRVDVATFARIEQRNFWYSDDRPSDSDARFRFRLETKLALNRPDLATDGVWYMIADSEWYVPLNDVEPAERFATKRRLRLGIGYRHDYQLRAEVIFMRDKARDTLVDDIDIDANILDFKVKWFF